MGPFPEKAPAFFFVSRNAVGPAGQLRLAAFVSEADVSEDSDNRDRQKCTLLVGSFDRVDTKTKHDK